VNQKIFVKKKKEENDEENETVFRGGENKTPSLSKIKI
jgi:hypothetical protein